MAQSSYSKIKLKRNNFYWLVHFISFTLIYSLWWLRLKQRAYNFFRDGHPRRSTVKYRTRCQALVTKNVSPRLLLRVTRPILQRQDSVCQFEVNLMFLFFRNSFLPRSYSYKLSNYLWFKGKLQRKTEVSLVHRLDFRRFLQSGLRGLNSRTAAGSRAYLVH